MAQRRLARRTVSRPENSLSLGGDAGLASVRMRTQSARQAIRRLHAIRNHYGPAPAAEKAALLAALDEQGIVSAGDARRLHHALSFLRAFPDSPEVHRRASSGLARFAGRVEALPPHQREALADTGIAGTVVHYPFSYAVAAWLARRFAGIAAIDWEAFDDTGRLDELLEHLLQAPEFDYFDSGRVTTREWLDIAAPRGSGTDFGWLMAQLAERQRDRGFWTALYNAAEIPLRCTLGEGRLCRTHNVLPAGAVVYRKQAMQSHYRHAQREIRRPVHSLRRLERRDGARLIDVAMSSLAVRHRETNHFNHANPAEVYVASAGKGVRIAAMGLLPEHRYPLECTMGFLILANGVPIGYGGCSMLFAQANTGINIFEEFRGSEAAWLWVQVMRLFRTLSGCSRFIANPYQFGSENSEALRSGAFWFYYRLGYRPVEADVRALARQEHAKLEKRAGYRTPIAVLKELAACDMHLTLPGARRSALFEESWLETCALLATRQLALTGQVSRRKASAALAEALRRDLCIPSLDGWTKEERAWFARLAPLVAAVEPSAWPARSKKSLAALMRSKGGAAELDFLRRCSRHPDLMSALRKVCRRES